MATALIHRPLPARLFLVVVAALATTVGLALPAHAEALVDASDAPQVRSDQTVDGSAYLAGQNVSVAGTVQGDLYCAGNSVTITGTVLGDVLCAANTITLTGTVDGDVRLAGNTVSLGGATAGAATVASNTVTTPLGSTIGSDLTVGGNAVDLAGSVGRDVRMGAATATVAGSVGRDVDAEVQKLSVSEGASITGHLHYTSNEDATIAPGTVQGDVQRTTPPPTERYQGPTFGTWVAFALFWIAGFVVLSVLVALVLPRYVRSTASRDWRDLGMALLIGFLVVLAAGPAALLLLVTGVGALAALLLWSALGVAMMIGSVLVAYTIGRAVLSHREGHVVGTTALGAVMLAVVGAVPVVGWFVLFLAACTGLGMIVRGLRSQYEPHPVAGGPHPGPYPGPRPGPYPGSPGPSSGPYPGTVGPPTYRPGPGQHEPMQPGPTYGPGPTGPAQGRPTPGPEPRPEHPDDVRLGQTQEFAATEGERPPQETRPAPGGSHPAGTGQEPGSTGRPEPGQEARTTRESGPGEPPEAGQESGPSDETGTTGTARKD